MMKVPSRHSNQVKLKRLLIAALICGGGVLTTGCGIPGLRGALPGPSVPQGFSINNGKPFWSSGVYSTKVDESKFKQSSEDEKSLNRKSDDDSDQADADGDDDAAMQFPPSPIDLSALEIQPVSNDEAKTFASLIKTASFLQKDDASDADDIDAKIKEMEDDLNRGTEKTTDDVDARIKSIEDDLRDGKEEEGSDNDSDKQANLDDIEFLNDGLIDTNIGISVAENAAYQPQAAFYTDPYLVDLITETIRGNQELRILSEEIRIACNEAYARSGEYRPFVTLGAGAGFDKVGEHTRFGAVEEQLQVANGRDFPEPLGDFMTAADVSWEIDIWKKLRNSQRAAAMRYLGTREGRNYVITRIVAEVAENYYELLAFDNQLMTLQRTIEIQQSSLKVALAKKQAGRGTELAVQRFRAEVEKNKAQWTLIEQKIVEAENRINFLAGRYPQTVQRDSVQFVDLNMTTLGSGVPSELLQNRADIRQAEREVAAAGLDIQVARARFYPSLSLTAGLGWNAFSTGFLFRTPESLIYGMAGELVGPLINKRAIKAAYCSANAAQLQAIYNYQQTVLEAHIETVNHLTKVENFRRSIEVKKQQLDALEKSVDAANKLFQNARAEYVEVLLAQRELQEARMELIEIKQEQLSAIVNAYQALGGGGF